MCSHRSLADTWLNFCINFNHQNGLNYGLNMVEYSTLYQNISFTLLTNLRQRLYQPLSVNFNLILAHFYPSLEIWPLFFQALCDRKDQIFLLACKDRAQDI